MKALEIFNARRKLGTMSRDYGKTIDDVLHIDDAKELDVIETALTPKTADEICKELDAFLKERDVETLSDVMFNGLTFWFYDSDDYDVEICRYDEMDNSLVFWSRNNLTPKLIREIATLFETLKENSI